jgi:hypothetical protein
VQNETYTKLYDGLATHLGAGAPLDTGNGVRFTSPKKGKATVYHSNVAAGNQAEVAFEVVSMSNRLAISEGEFRSFVADLRASTGRSVDPNPQHGWPRVGVATDRDVSIIVDAITSKLVEAE